MKATGRDAPLQYTVCGRCCVDEGGTLLERLCYSEKNEEVPVVAKGAATHSLIMREASVNQTPLLDVYSQSCYRTENSYIHDLFS